MKKKIKRRTDKSIIGEYKGLKYRLLLKRNLLWIENINDGEMMQYNFANHIDEIDNLCEKLNISLIEALILAAYEKRDSIVYFENVDRYKILTDNDLNGNVKFLIEKKGKKYIYNSEQEMIEKSKEEIGTKVDLKKFMKIVNGELAQIDDGKFLWAGN